MTYASGNTISIFPIMMVVMMAVRPFKTLLSMSTTFKTLDGDTGTTSALGQKVYCSIGQSLKICLRSKQFSCLMFNLIVKHLTLRNYPM